MLCSGVLVSCCPGPGSSWGDLAVPPPSKEGESPSNNVLFQSLIKELNYSLTDVSIACDDEQIEANEMFEISYKRYRHPATDSGILLQIQAFCCRYRHPITDSGILLQIQEF